MDSDFVGKVGDLKQQLEEAKQSLVVLNDNIRRFVGRSSKDTRGDKHKPTEFKRVDSEKDRQSVRNDNFKTKRRSYDAKAVFNRLSGATLRLGDKEEPRPRLTSRVIRELPTREEIVEAQGTDSESRARNRRMFGSLLGTLHKFCQEESRLKPKEDKKAQIEKKLEEQELQERESLKKERESLFLDRKRKQLEIKKIELKMHRLKDFEVWESSTSELKYHIRTKTKPYIFFRPRVMSSKTEKLLAESTICVETSIEMKKEQLHKELMDLEKITELDGEFQADEVPTADGSVEEENGLRSNDNDKSSDANTSNKTSERIGSVVESVKNDLDAKENKSRNTSDQTMTSSIVIVKNKSSIDRSIK